MRASRRSLRASALHVLALWAAPSSGHRWNPSRHFVQEFLHSDVDLSKYLGGRLLLRCHLFSLIIAYRVLFACTKAAAFVGSGRRC